MARWNLRRYDVQARVSVVLSLASVVCLAALAVAIATASWQDNRILYQSGTLRVPAVYVCGLLAIGFGAGGFGFGLNSAGQRRNDRTTQSWLGFFLGAASITFAVILLILFLLWGEAQPA